MGGRFLPQAAFRVELWNLFLNLSSGIITTNLTNQTNRRMKPEEEYLTERTEGPRVPDSQPYPLLLMLPLLL